MINATGDALNPLHSGLEDLARFIREAKLEIASIQPSEISTDHIPRATDELDAVVGATEEATNKIMDVCDEISVLAATCPSETGEKLIACTTRLFEACNFQDITGQRITKVVATLKHIDVKVAALLQVFGDKVDSSLPVKAATPTNPLDEAALLNGPQLEKNAIDQNEIDRLMSGS
jgi:chemotaxis protein CheZ